MRSHTLALLLLTAGSFVTRSVAQNGPETALRGNKKFSKRVITSGLAGPWELAWGPDSKLWVTERSGKRVTRIDPESGARTVAVTIEEVSAPGGQDGLLGMTFHPELLKGTGNDFVYLYYTYVDRQKEPVPYVADPDSPFRHLYAKLVRFRYDSVQAKLVDPVELIKGFPAGNDHVAGRLKFGPDSKLYLTLGDRGHNQLGNFCKAIESQRLPTRQELAASSYISYVGKSLRINLDGSIPADNPKLNGVVSHVYTYGHRNPQGLDFAPDGTLYSSEHGPKTDDEVNVLRKGGNYGWPHIAGYRDNKAFEYARWADARTPCSQLKFSDLAIHPDVPRATESSFRKKIVEPLATLFTVPTGFHFSAPACNGVDYICWPTIGVSSVEHYEAGANGIPGWDRVLLVPALKRGSLYVVMLKPDGKSAAGPIYRFFNTENRYRDTAVSPDRRTLFVATDAGGLAESRTGGVTRNMENDGAILAFSYMSEGPDDIAPAPPVVSDAMPSRPREAIAGAGPPAFTPAQAAAGKTAYNANCAVCHGSTLTNGTFGTPLGGEYFKREWFGRSVQALHDKSRKTMPPAAPNSLPVDTYTNVLAYILEMNGFRAGESPLPNEGEGLQKMAIQ